MTERFDPLAEEEAELERKHGFVGRVFGRGDEDAAIDQARYEKAVKTMHDLGQLLPGSAFDASVEDDCVVLDTDDAAKLILMALEGHALKRRYRKRDVLVAQLTVFFTTALPTEDLRPEAGNLARMMENLAERCIDTLGTALLVEGERPQTANVATGETEEMSVEEFLAREHGRRQP